MGSGCKNTELTSGAKKFRERKRREKNHLKRVIALGVPQAKAAKLNCKEMRELLRHPTKTQKQYAAKTAATG